MSFLLVLVTETTAIFKLMLQNLFLLHKYPKDVQSQLHVANVNIW